MKNLLLSLLILSSCSPANAVDEEEIYLPQRDTSLELHLGYYCDVHGHLVEEDKYFFYIDWPVERDGEYVECYYRDTYRYYPPKYSIL